MALELVPLCTATVDDVVSLSLGRTPVGRRVIGLARMCRWEGERLRASGRELAEDWLAVAPDGTGMVDARLVLETDDGALIAVRYTGRADMRAEGSPVFYVTPQFETADERYTWLNKIQAVAKGTVRDGRLEYEVYELR